MARKTTADHVAESCEAYVEDMVMELSDEDYVEVMNTVAHSCKTAANAKREEMGK